MSKLCQNKVKIEIIHYIYFDVFSPSWQTKNILFLRKNKYSQKSILIVRKFPCVERSKKKLTKKFGSRSIMFQISRFIFEFANDAKTSFYQNNNSSNKKVKILFITKQLCRVQFSPSKVTWGKGILYLIFMAWPD